MGASVWSGALGLIYGGGSAVVQSLLPPPLVLLWQVTLLVSGFLGIGAAVLALRDPVTSLLLERIALVMVGSFAVIFGGVTQWKLGTDGLYVAAMTGGYGLACLARVWQVNQTLSWMRARARSRAAAEAAAADETNAES